MAVVAFAAFSPSAYAQSPAGTGYDETDVIGQLPGGGDGGEVLPEVVSGGGGDEASTPPVSRESGAGGSTSPTTATSGSLPFTGFDVGIIALMGLVLLGTGLALRRGRLFGR